MIADMDENNRYNSFNDDLNNNDEFITEDESKKSSESGNNSAFNNDEFFVEDDNKKSSEEIRDNQYRNVFYSDRQEYGNTNQSYTSNNQYNASYNQNGTSYSQSRSYSGNNFTDNNQYNRNNVSYGGDYGYVTNDPSYKKPKKKKGKLAIAITASVLGVMILVAGFVFFIVYYINPLLKDAELNKTSTSKDTGSYKIPVESTPEVQTTTNASGVLTRPQVAKKVSASVVCVVIKAASGEGVGSGVIMSSDGYIATNAHVVEGATSVSVVLNDGSKKDAKIIGYDERTDLAVIKIDATGLSKATFGDSDKTVVGEEVLAIGNPYGLELSNTVTNGIISAVRKDILLDNQRMSLLQTNAQINPGNSGGPLVNMYGQVIGITSLKIMASNGTTSEGLGFAIPINTAKPILEELINNGYVTNRPMIGITGNYIDEASAAPFGYPTGIFVQAVDKTSDAAKKGIKAGDIITKINNKDIKSMDEFMSEKEKYGVGDSITLTVYSAGVTRNVKIILVENKPKS